MNKDKKIKIQEKIIHQLKEENSSLSGQINELRKIVDDNKEILESASMYCDEHKKCIVSLIEAKEKYVQATKNIIKQQMEYKREIDSLLKTIKKNI